MNRVRRLAKEIGAPYVPEHETPEFMVAWVKMLARTVATHAHSLYRYPADVHKWCDAIAAADGYAALYETCCIVRESISAIDDGDDGWAADPAGAAIEAVSLALLPETRWLAEASTQVWAFATGCHGYNAVILFSREAWLRDQYALVALESARPDNG